jgi:hypothetical protein
MVRDVPVVRWRRDPARAGAVTAMAGLALAWVAPATSRGWLTFFDTVPTATPVRATARRLLYGLCMAFLIFD